MASLNYNIGVWSCASQGYDLTAGNNFKMALMTTSYTPNKDTHQYRSDLTGEASGSGYTAGGIALVHTINYDTVNDRTEYVFTTTTFTSVTLTNVNSGVIYFNSGAASTDFLLSYVDFTATNSPVAQNFVVTFTAPYRYQN